MNNDTSILLATLQNQPVERIQRDGVEYVLLGTAHVSSSSVQAVKALLELERFDAVAVELCPHRVQRMNDPEAFGQLDLFQVIGQGKTGMVIASLVLSSFQKRLADQYGTVPGGDMKMAMDIALANHLPLWPIDREIGITLKRAWHRLGVWQRFNLIASLLENMFERDPVNEHDIEKLKQGDLLESAMGAFASHSPLIYRSLITERDAYMAACLRAQAPGINSTEPHRVLVVIGAGHLRGLSEKLHDQQGEPNNEITQLKHIPPKKHWPKWMAVGLVWLIFALIGWAFYRDTALGALALRDWIMYTGSAAALGALIARAHPLSILAACIAAPIKPFRPGIPSGIISALVEARIRKPKVIDFESLRHDIMHWSGWWKNRVTRTLLNCFMVSLCTVIGEYLAGIHIIHRLW